MKGHRSECIACFKASLDPYPEDDDLPGPVRKQIEEWQKEVLQTAFGN